MADLRFTLKAEGRDSFARGAGRWHAWFIENPNTLPILRYLGHVRSRPSRRYHGSGLEWLAYTPAGELVSSETWGHYFPDRCEAGRRLIEHYRARNRN